MYNKILIRYGELSLKKRNKMSFVNHLESNLKRIHKLNPIVTFDRMFLNYSEENMEELKNVIGISSYSPVLEMKTDLENIKINLLKMLNKKTGTFKVQARRSWKAFEKNSMELNQEMGEFILTNTDLKVDVKNPDYCVEIEVHQNSTYLFFEKFEAIGGLPVGVNGKVIHLMSGGIDSPVAAFLLMKRGIHVDFLSFITPPQTDEATVEKIKSLIINLKKFQGESKLYLAIYTELMESLSMMSDQSYKITLMRRSFYRIATKIAKENNYLAISNGENLGQVASQTLESISVINTQCDLPVFRPLLTNDKNETIKIAEKIGTFSISIQPAKETCELFAPDKPVIKPTIERAKKAETEYPDIFKMEEELINNMVVIKL